MIDERIYQNWSSIDLPNLLLSLGEDLSREGLLATPRRVKAAWHEFLEGYTLEPEELLKTTFKAESTSAQMCHNIHFVSICEHHLLPFTGYVHIAYKPSTCVVGLSKLTRLVDCFAKRLQIQERMVQQIATTLDSVIKPRFVIVIAEGRHLCCHGRGIRRTEMTFTTTALCGKAPTELVDTLLLKGNKV